MILGSLQGYAEGLGSGAGGRPEPRIMEDAGLEQSREAIFCVPIATPPPPIHIYPTATTTPSKDDAGRLREWQVANCDEVVREHLPSQGDKLARLRLAAEGHGDDPSAGPNDEAGPAGGEDAGPNFLFLGLVFALDFCWKGTS
ncbi:hypothetical protein GGTG_12131 [Gaeumannomyces tritici R3-111a-1]|uniref:Uncharacterized protein n=1 Tax=Gaeumannomyces tritici (strain R3-111a-1) TaxID=644352 RepID=J3PF52_GAET3|nr:hypothetical protein GGTG_12131 [Gaeumannomyces tritici R3-111a-1]EJT69954.1 hypothetical protein GGTG_12131 [Gaeumannomyces tritici R3-111a-1]